MYAQTYGFPVSSARTRGSPLPDRSTLLPTVPPDTPISARAADRQRGKHSQNPLADLCIPTPPANCAADATNPLALSSFLPKARRVLSIYTAAPLIEVSMVVILFQ